MWFFGVVSWRTLIIFLIFSPKRINKFQDGFSGRSCLLFPVSLAYLWDSKWTGNICFLPDLLSGRQTGKHQHHCHCNDNAEDVISLWTSTLPNEDSYCHDTDSVIIAKVISSKPSLDWPPWPLFFSSFDVIIILSQCGSGLRGLSNIRRAGKLKSIPLWILWCPTSSSSPPSSPLAKFSLTLPISGEKNVFFKSLYINNWPHLYSDVYHV